MSDKRQAMLEKRARLQAQCEAQRAEIAAHVAGLARPIALADRIVGMTTRISVYLRAHPLVLGALVAALVVLRRRGLWKLGKHALAQRSRVLRWGERGLIIWRTWRALRSRRANA